MPPYEKGAKENLQLLPERKRQGGKRLLNRTYLGGSDNWKWDQRPLVGGRNGDWVIAEVASA